MVNSFPASVHFRGVYCISDVFILGAPPDVTQKRHKNNFTPSNSPFISVMLVVLTIYCQFLPFAQLHSPIKLTKFINPIPEMVHGYSTPHQESIERVEAGAAGYRSCGVRDRIVYFTVVDEEKTSAGAEPDRHVREDRASTEIPARAACQPRRAAAPRTAQATVRGPAGPFAAQRAGIDPPQVSSRKGQGDPRDF